MHWKQYFAKKNLFLPCVRRHICSSTTSTPHNSKYFGATLSIAIIRNTCSIDYLSSRNWKSKSQKEVHHSQLIPYFSLLPLPENVVVVAGFLLHLLLRFLFLLYMSWETTRHLDIVVVVVFSHTRLLKKDTFGWTLLL